MMYLSRVRVTTEGLDRKCLVSLLSGDAYANHQLLWRLFGDATERSFLFRQETEQDQLSPDHNPRGLPLFYVLSEQVPTAVPGLLELETKPFSPALATGDQLTFRLRANPTISRKTESGRSARHDVLMDAKSWCKHHGVNDRSEVQSHMVDAAITWLNNQSEKSGFNMVSAPQLTGYRQHAIRRKGTEIRFSSIDYEGVLTVTHPERFKDMLCRGLGRSKAFGCGLMMVRRA
ncbi:type I-E CRISPR-associated protein Cas6/Cse3/CasE [Marinobacter sp. SS8-8]|uniref:type I-E CRISPR-associated protein Cas6/Cse3/CasE n=1 Tax=Marinobacter sp. SS8-8 TaxID=3050452 RepID=UPI0026E04029|nr:type I-E CRISPR-associated protein Cas6/Cse3/CasE [Marinobacter sp. SS8-8]